MNAKIITGSANLALAADIALRFHTELTPPIVERLPDRELPVGIHATVPGQDVFLRQPTGPPVAEHLFELLLLADACHCAGAKAV